MDYDKTMKQKDFWWQWRTIVTGMMMGAADLVPGISGGTVALLSGIYGRLLAAISGVDLTFANLLARGQVAQAWRHLDASFLVNLGLGIGVSLLLLSIMQHAMICRCWKQLLVKRMMILQFRGLARQQSSVLDGLH